MACITHPMIKPDAIESREYQLSIAMRALDGNTMVILPTCPGKTAGALYLCQNNGKRMVDGYLLSPYQGTR